MCIFIADQYIQPMRLLIIVFLLLSQTCAAQFAIPQDKLLHLSAGYVIGATTTSIVYNITEDRRKAFIYGVAASVIIGGLKEVYDIKHGDPDLEDWGYDVAGGVLGSITIVIKF